MKLTPTEEQDCQRIAELGNLLRVLLIMFRLDRPLSTAEVAEAAGLNLETARLHLRELSRQGLIAGSAPHWILTAGGRQLILPVRAENPRGIEPSSSSSALTEPNTCSREEAEEETRKIRADFPRGFSAPQAVDPPILEAFQEAGIGLNKRTERLARQPWITPAYIRAHHAALAKHGKVDAAGLLITILESGEPAPPPPDDRLNGRRYIEGKYSKFIEH